MSALYQLRHYTVYRYDEPVEAAQNQLRMHLRELPGQRCMLRAVHILPRPSWTRLQTDYFGNRVLAMQLGTPHRVSKIFVKHRVRVQTRPLRAPQATPSWETVLGLLNAAAHAQDPQLAMLRLPSRLAPCAPALADFARPHFAPGRPVLEAGIALMQAIHRDFAFNPKATSIATPVLEVLRTRAGVCQDFAHLMVAALRSLGLAARYVSGYIETLPPPGQPKLVGADASHAWVSLWCGPEAGWQDLDPTNALRPQGQHLVTAWGRDYDDVIPLNGVLAGGAGETRMQVRVDLRRVEAATGPGEPPAAAPGQASP